MKIDHTGLKRTARTAVHQDEWLTILTTRICEKCGKKDGLRLCHPGDKPDQELIVTLAERPIGTKSLKRQIGRCTVLCGRCWLLAVPPAPAAASGTEGSKG